MMHRQGRGETYAGQAAFDTIAYDSTGDGLVDRIEYDTTGDGEVDTIEWDLTGRGAVDRRVTIQSGGVATVVFDNSDRIRRTWSSPRQDSSTSTETSE